MEKRKDIEPRLLEEVRKGNFEVSLGLFRRAERENNLELMNNVYSAMREHQKDWISLIKEADVIWDNIARGKKEETPNPSPFIQDSPRGILESFLSAPDSQLDACIVERIEKVLGQPMIFPGDIQSLLDDCCFHGAASGFAMHALHIVQDMIAKGLDLG